MNEELRLKLIYESIIYCKRVKAMGMPASAYSKALREPVHFLWERRNGSKINAAQFRSVNAGGLKFGNNELIYDHAIPFKHLQEILLSSEDLPIDELKQILEKYIVVCLITKDEEKHLNSLGLSKKMPENWDKEDPLARYKAGNIEVVQNS